MPSLASAALTSVIARSAAWVSDGPYADRLPVSGITEPMLIVKLSLEAACRGAAPALPPPAATSVAPAARVAPSAVATAALLPRLARRRAPRVPSLVAVLVKV